MLTIEEMRRQKRIMGYTNELLAIKSGVPLGTVQKIMAGITKSPRQKTLQALSNALISDGHAISVDRDGSGWFEQYMNRKPLKVSEEAVAYNAKKKRYTLKDREALPNGVRAELIDGQLYFMASPSMTHQRIIAYLYMVIAQYIQSNGGDCEAFLSPFDVFPDNDDSVVVPDLTVICDPDKLDERGCHGAPDWVIEVMSPSSKKVDAIIKLNKYRQSGVREYWLVIPSKRLVIVYDFATANDSESITFYSFDDDIPVRIYPDLSISLSTF